jgi:hypothetical protein
MPSLTTKILNLKSEIEPDDRKVYGAGATRSVKRQSMKSPISSAIQKAFRGRIVTTAEPTKAAAFQRSFSNRSGNRLFAGFRRRARPGRFLSAVCRASSRMRAAACRKVTERKPLVARGVFVDPS